MPSPPQPVEQERHQPGRRDQPRPRSLLCRVLLLSMSGLPVVPGCGCPEVSGAPAGAASPAPDEAATGRLGVQWHEWTTPHPRLPPPSTPGWPRRPAAPRPTCSPPTPGTSGAPTSASAPGAPCARTTPRTATPGAPSPTTTPARAPTGGTRTGWRASRDLRHELCLGLALWNGRDPILKERMFGLAGPEGNHGEDAKEYWWYLEGLPSHALLHWRYHYPQGEFPYERLVHHGRGLQRPRARAARHRRLRRRPLLVGRRDVRQGHPDRGAHARGRREPRAGRGHPRRAAHPVVPQHLVVGRGGAPAAHRARRHLAAGRRARPGRLPAGCRARPRRPRPRGAVLRERHQPAAGLRRARRARSTPRTASTTTSSPAPPPSTRAASAPRPRCGTGSPSPPAARPSCGCACTARMPATGPAEPDWAASAFDAVVTAREADADEFYAALAPAGTTTEEQRVLRQASAGLVWSKQIYPYDVGRWLDGDPGQPPPAGSRRGVRNDAWRHLDSFDVLAMPDPWEYPWFAAWDLAFHAVAWAHLDPAFAKYQTLVLLREWFQHPNGALPAYEWNFDDVNPPDPRAGGAAGLPDRRRARPRVPRARLPEAARQLHLVAQPRGRGRQQRLRRRVPRAGQHQPDRPLQAARRRPAGAGRRHGVDGVLRDVDARHRGRARAGEPRLRRHGRQVPRAVPPDPAGPGGPGPLRHRGRLLLRPAGAPVR